MDAEAIKNKEYSEASDVYSFGVFLWELFTGLKPWEEYSALETSIRVCSGERLSLQVVKDPILRDIIKRCWNPKPKKRITMQEMADELQQYYEKLSPEDSYSYYSPSSMSIEYQLDNNSASESVIEYTLQQYNSTESADSKKKQKKKKVTKSNNSSDSVIEYSLQQSNYTTESADSKKKQKKKKVTKSTNSWLPAKEIFLNPSPSSEKLPCGEYLTINTDW